VKPKKGMTGYMCFITRYLKTAREKMGENDASVSNGECVKKGAAIWNEMNEEAKKEFHDIAKLDEIRHQRELEEFNSTGFFINKNGVNSKDIEPKLKKVKMAVGAQIGGVEAAPIVTAVVPKKAKVAFMFFMKERSPIVMKENGLNSCAKAAKLLGQVWSQMSVEEKKPYDDLNRADIERHKQ
jgi:hypothetical protein